MGMLQDISSTLTGKLGINLRGLNINATQEVFQCRLTVQIDNLTTVENICSALREIKGVQKATRIS